MPTTAPTAIARELEKLKKQLEGVPLPEYLQEKVTDMLQRLERFAQGNDYTQEYDRVAHYVDWISSLPWDKKSADILDLTTSKQVLDKNHYGMGEIKER